MKRLYIAGLLTAALLWCMSGPASAQVRCNNSVVYDASTNGSTQLVAPVPAGRIFICGFAILSPTATTVSLVYGTGTACATGRVSLTPAWQIGTAGQIVVESPAWNGLFVPPANALCILTGAGNAVQALVKFIAQ